MRAVRRSSPPAGMSGWCMWSAHANPLRIRAKSTPRSSHSVGSARPTARATASSDPHRLGRSPTRSGIGGLLVVSRTAKAVTFLLARARAGKPTAGSIVSSARARCGHSPGRRGGGDPDPTAPGGSARGTASSYSRARARVPCLRSPPVSALTIEQRRAHGSSAASGPRRLIGDRGCGAVPLQHDRGFADLAHGDPAAYRLPSHVTGCSSPGLEFSSHSSIPAPHFMGFRDRRFTGSRGTLARPTTGDRRSG